MQKNYIMTSSMRENSRKNKKLPENSSNKLHEYEVDSMNNLSHEITERTVAKAEIRGTTDYMPRARVPIGPPDRPDDSVPIGPPDRPGDSKETPISTPKERIEIRTEFTSYKETHDSVSVRENFANKSSTTTSSTLKSKGKSVNA